MSNAFQSIPLAMVTRRQPIDEVLTFLIKYDLDALFSMIADKAEFILEDATEIYDFAGHYFSQNQTISGALLTLFNSGTSGNLSVTLKQWRGNTKTPIATSTGTLASAGNGAPNGALVTFSQVLNVLGGDCVSLHITGIPLGAPEAFRGLLLLAPGSGGSAGSPEPYYYTVLAADITNYGITLPYTPAEVMRVLLDPKSGPRQWYGDDYTVSGNFLSWAGLGFASIVSAGDKILITYA